MPSEMDEQLFRRYSELKRQIAALDDELRTLQPRILVQLKPLQNARLNTAFGQFTVLRKANWTYSEAVSRLEEQVKARQKQEKADGTAKADYTEYVQFKALATAAPRSFGATASP